ncbi:hypothetical protein [Micromonospora zamorensis]|uniref:hypothetical protein n=1 Tax=Micromonospora zamorensis TaxID=709883 RepID=UPI0037A92399
MFIVGGVDSREGVGVRMLVGVVVHPTRPQAAETADMVPRIGAEHGAASQALDVWQDEQSPADVLAGMAQRPQLVVTIGGDGTLLRG